MASNDLPIRKAPAGSAALRATVFLLASTAMVLAAWHANPTSGRASEQTDKKVESPWQRWLNEEVVYLISNEEKTAFEGLKTDEEREHFVQAFWDRRNPWPGSAWNQFKEEYYRRIAYANQHYASNKPGWKTDRGQRSTSCTARWMKSTLTPPPAATSAPSAKAVALLDCPFEDWRYANSNHGSLSIEFIDPSSSGEYRMTLDTEEKYKKL